MVNKIFIFYYEIYSYTETFALMREMIYKYEKWNH